VGRDAGAVVNLTVLGTGTADGWPDARCRCSSCTASRSTGTLRGSTSALLDGSLLLDCGPGTPYAVQRSGQDLTGLRHVLLTRTEPGTRWDLLHPGGATVLVLAPARVLAEVPGDARLDLRAVSPGDRLRLGSHEVRVLAAGGDGVVYDVAGPTGRLLHAPATGPLPEDTLDLLRDAALDVLLLDETWGDPGHGTGHGPGHGGGHLDLVSFPEELRRLRAVGAVTGTTDVVAVHLSHHNPPGDRLARRLAPWGARVVDDGTSLHARPAAPGPGRTLLIGGARSGKSAAAEGLLAVEQAVTYVATAYPAAHDEEWSQRVRLHQGRRPRHWTTLETLDLVPLLEAPGEPLLVDCLTLWLTRVMDRHGAWDDATWAASGEAALRAEVTALAQAWRTTSRRVVAVTNEVGQGVVPDTAAGRRFRDEMGRVNAAVAAVTEDVLWCVAGQVTPL
jgi:adenosylcobinamide kinase/adenosylcobinamide-phosphate guanylyltransferase